MVPGQSYSPRIPGWAGYSAYQRPSSRMTSSNSTAPIDDTPPPADYSGNGIVPDIYRPGGVSLLPSGGLGGFYPTYPGMQFNSPVGGGGGSGGGNMGNPADVQIFTSPNTGGTNPRFQPTLPALQAPGVTYPPAWGNPNQGGGGGTGGGGALKVFDPSNPAAGGMDSSGQWHDPAGQNFDATSWFSAHAPGATNYGAVGNAPPARVNDSGATMFTNQHYVDEDGIIRLKNPANLVRPQANFGTYPMS